MAKEMTKVEQWKYFDLYTYYIYYCVPIPNIQIPKMISSRNPREKWDRRCRSRAMEGFNAFLTILLDFNQDKKKQKIVSCFKKSWQAETWNGLPYLERSKDVDAGLKHEVQHPIRWDLPGHDETQRSSQSHSKMPQRSTLSLVERQVLGSCASRESWRKRFGVW